MEQTFESIKKDLDDIGANQIIICKMYSGQPELGLGCCDSDCLVVEEVAAPLLA